MAARIRPPPARPRGVAGPGAPAPGECHLWLVRAEDHPRWRCLLSADDEARAAACHGDAARREVVTSAALQRVVAAHYLGVPPAAVVVRRRCSACGAEGHGRPHVRWATSGEPAPWSAADAPDMSATHSAGLVLLAVTGSGRVGVDLEARERPVDVTAVSRLVCSPAERAVLDGLHGSRRTRRFLELWVRKEAVLKVVGRGLDGPWRDVDVLSGTVRLPPQLWPGRLFTRGLPGIAGLAAAAGHRVRGPVVAAVAGSRPAVVVRHLGLRDLRPGLWADPCGSTATAGLSPGRRGVAAG
jgi:4'-phosphopantetheinyl transferase